MFYTIKYATSHKGGNNIQVYLDKNGNMYIVSAWEKGSFKTVERIEASRYEEAEIAFDAMCKKYNMFSVHEPEQTWDATEFD